MYWKLLLCHDMNESFPLLFIFDLLDLPAMKKPTASWAWIKRFTREKEKLLLKHRIIVGRHFGNFLHHVPMLNYFAVFETENIYNRLAAVTRFAN